MLLKSEIRNLSSAASQQGNASFLIIVIIVILFAVMLAGGSSSLTSGNIPSPEPTKPDSVLPTTGLAPTATPTPVTQWTVVINFLGCNIDGFPKANVVSTGSSNGYILVEVDNGNGTFNKIGTGETIQPQSTNPVSLLNRLEFNTKPWKVSLFEGGTKSGESWSGGTLKTTANGSPTGC